MQYVHKSFFELLHTVMYDLVTHHLQHIITYVFLHFRDQIQIALE